MMKAALTFYKGSSLYMKSLLLTCFILLFVHSKAQRFLEPSVGYSIDLNNASFRQLSVAMQLARQTGANSEFVLRLQLGLPLSTSSAAPAYTANPALPLSVMASKKILPLSIAFLPGWRIQLGNSKGNDRFFAIPMVGVKYERIEVQYSYDKNNYTILNPDKTLSRPGATAGLCVEYMHLLKKGRFLTALQLVAPTVGPASKYPSSFRFGFPLSFQVGYSIAFLKH